MGISQDYIKLILGLKIKQLRTERGMSLSELAGKSGLSVSYLNEIESGKKYPKSNKIALLASALGTTYDKLVSLRLNKQLAPIGELLESNILEKLPLEHYGIDLNKFISVMSSAPTQLSALVSTIIDLAKSSEMSENNFSRTALRTYKEINDNYFEDLESAADDFIERFNTGIKPQVTYKVLEQILTGDFNYQIDYDTLSSNELLSHLRGYSQNGNGKKLFINNKLSDAQKAFIIAKELGYNYLGLNDRAYVYANLPVDNFDHLLNNFKSSYFANSVLLNKQFFVDDIKRFFAHRQFKEEYIIRLINKYNTSPEMFFQRLSNLSGKYLGLGKYFFMRFNSTLPKDEFFLSKEVRLNLRHKPGGYQTQEHLCRRWISVDNLRQLKKEFKKNKKMIRAGIIHSRFADTNDEYLAISVAKASSFQPGFFYSVTIGYLFDSALVEKVNFSKDESIPFQIVNNTCETCSLNDCEERAAEPSLLERERYLQQIKEALIAIGKD